ncbi:MAG: CBS domain-containing protein [Armatimonadia bacterium]|nr:CBS domain-containing protein [Armatimonadia bacterium]
MHGWKIGKIFGINIEIHFTWLIIFGLILWLVTQELGQRVPEVSGPNLWITVLITTVLFFVCLILHELSHSLMANHQGADVSRITLFVFGGVSQLKKEPDSPMNEFKVAIVGPLTSLVLAVVFWGIAEGLQALEVPRLIWTATRWVAGINLALAIFNMLPAFPLDGGRVLRSILWGAWDSLDRATRAASKAGQFFGYAMIGLGFLGLVLAPGLGGLWMVALGWLISSAAAGSYQRLQLQQALGDVYVHDLMSSPVQTIPADTDLATAANQYFMTARFTAFGVEEGGRIVGIVRMEDLKEVPREQWQSTTIGQVTPELDRETMTVNSDEEAVEAMMQMAEHDHSRVLVTDQSGDVIGILSQTDIRRLIKVKSGLGV